MELLFKLEMAYPEKYFKKNRKLPSHFQSPNYISSNLFNQNCNFLIKFHFQHKFISCYTAYMFLRIFNTNLFLVMQLTCFYVTTMVPWAIGTHTKLLLVLPSVAVVLHHDVALGLLGVKGLAVPSEKQAILYLNIYLIIMNKQLLCK